jgi:hypothetical protein
LALELVPQPLAATVITSELSVRFPIVSDRIAGQSLATAFNMRAKR